MTNTNQQDYDLINDKIYDLYNKVMEHEQIEEKLNMRIKKITEKIDLELLENLTFFSPWVIRQIKGKLNIDENEPSFSSEDDEDEMFDFVHTSAKEYDTDVFQALERGELPTNISFKRTMFSAINELVSKPNNKKSDIEKKVDQIFVDYLPEVFVRRNSVNVSSNVNPRSFWKIMKKDYTGKRFKFWKDLYVAYGKIEDLKKLEKIGSKKK